MPIASAAAGTLNPASIKRCASLIRTASTRGGRPSGARDYGEHAARDSSRIGAIAKQFGARIPPLAGGPIEISMIAKCGGATYDDPMPDMFERR